MERRGLFIVLEGSDGSGKTTQFNLLTERLKATGYEVATFDFPRYDQKSAHFIKSYLNGDYGPAASVNPYTASLFYALDRYEAGKDINQALADGKIVLADRYVGSNMAHQGAKFSDPVEQRGFFVWEDNLEFQLLNIPRPDINLFLRVPAKVSYKLIEQRGKHTYIDKNRDQHEADLGHLKKAVTTYDLLCQLFPKDFTAIECTADGELLGITDINNLIWQKVQPLLPADKPHQAHSVVVSLSDNSKPSAETGDESATELTQNYKSASLWLKFQIARLKGVKQIAGTYEWEKSGYDFYTPQGLSRELKPAYKQSIERLAELNRKVKAKLTRYYERRPLTDQLGLPPPPLEDIMLSITPLAALTDFKATFAKNRLQAAAVNLLSSDLDEGQWAAKQLYLAARQTWPAKFKQSLESDSGPEPLNSIIAKLADERLPRGNAATNEVKLLEVIPRQEFNLLAETIYPYSNLSLDQIVEEVAGWSYQQKFDSLSQSLSQPSAHLEKVQYKLDVVSDQLVIGEVIDTADLFSLQVQSASPRYGYEVPEVLESAGVEDLYLECFDESLKLYSLLQTAERDDLAIYATLAGHKVRWQLAVDATNLKKVLTHNGSQSYKLLSEAIHEKVAEAHPLIWEALSGSQAPVKPAVKTHGNRVKAHKRRAPKRGKNTGK